ncbi:MAG: 50S ribosomal protein L4 [Marinilabiliales bacterium]|nr:MAG: 50S ribosomal protein L4 [Marinilabiliales bacterium]
MELTVYNINGEKTSRTVELNDAVFGIEPNDHAIYLDSKQYLANQRQGTHKAKERGEVAGSTKKIKRQKGTGTARSGDIKNPLYRGGGRVFGPRPRNYSFKLNKKLKRLARCSALAYKVREENLIVVEDFTFEDHKTKNFVNVMNNMGLVNDKALFVMPESNENLYLASRNIPNVDVINAQNLNTYELLRASKLMVFESSIKKIEEICS